MGLGVHASVRASTPPAGPTTTSSATTCHQIVRSVTLSHTHSALCRWFPPAPAVPLPPTTRVPTHFCTFVLPFPHLPAPYLPHPHGITCDVDADADRSPEVMSSQPYDFKSDMWSLGCVLYEMMSLKHAFAASDMSGLVLKILRGEHLPIPSAFSADLKDLVKRLLSKDPRARPAPDQILKMPMFKVRAYRLGGRGGLQRHNYDGASGIFQGCVSWRGVGGLFRLRFERPGCCPPCSASLSILPAPLPAFSLPFSPPLVHPTLRRHCTGLPHTCP